MLDIYLKIKDSLNADNRSERLANLKKLNQNISKTNFDNNSAYKVNNHIHTTYSFSPYSPSLAVYMAKAAGLQTAGIMDHDTMNGVHEFMEAGRIMDLPTTVGMECRVDFSRTELHSYRLNNPDQKSIAYVAIHAVPSGRISELDDFFKPLRQYRQERNRIMINNINRIFRNSEINLESDRDVLPLSMAHDGGVMTERHLVFALSHKIRQKFPNGRRLVNYLENDLKIKIPEKNKMFLLDDANPIYLYDLLNVLKSSLVEMFYEPAGKECAEVKDIINLCQKLGAVSAYAYLGDVKESVTGDKKPQKFEDAYLEKLFSVIKNLGFKAVTYMPARNSREQLDRVRCLCEKMNLLQISGEDINSPRQSFICQKLKSPDYANLIDTTWALIGHERSEKQSGLYSEQSRTLFPDLDQRISYFKKKGKAFYE